jgi:hypothetical protein
VGGPGSGNYGSRWGAKPSTAACNRFDLTSLSDLAITSEQLVGKIGGRRQRPWLTFRDARRR